MTVNATAETRKQFTGDAGYTTSTDFTANFNYLSTSEIQVVHTNTTTATDTPYVEGTNYTVTSGASANSVTIRFLSGYVPTATTEYVTISRNMTLSQDTDYTEGSTLDAETLEQNFDKAIMISQQIKNNVTDLNLSFSETNDFNTTAAAASEIKTSKANRINKILSFDSNGDILATQEIGTFRGNWSSGATFQLRDLVKQSSGSDSSTQNNIYICTTAHTSTGSYLTQNDTSNWTLILDVATAVASADTATTQATKAGRHEDNAEAYAQTTAETLVTYTNPTSGATSNDGYSSLHYREKAKEWAGTGTGYALVTDDTGANTTEYSAKAWAAKPSGTVDGATASAKVSAANAATSASNASTSESNAASSATAAATSAANAAASYDSFDDRYLGTMANTASGGGNGVSGTYNATKDGPGDDNDGNALVTGALYFNTTDGEMRVYDGSNWIAASAAQNATILEYVYDITGSVTSIVGASGSGFAENNGAAVSFGSTESVHVYLNGVQLIEGASDDYQLTPSTNTVTLNSAAVSGDIVKIVVYKTFTVGDAVPASTGGTFSGNVSFGDNNITNVGDIAVDTISSDAGTSIGVNLGTDAGDDFNVGSGKLVVEGDTGNVGIGTSDPDGLLQVESSGQTDVYITAGNTSEANLLFGDSTLVTDAGIRYNNNGQYMRFITNNAERMRIKSGGDVEVKTGNLVIGTAGKGIDFSAGGSSDGITGEVLEHVETGTWTPALTLTSGSASVHTSYNTMAYTKIGNIVHIRGGCYINSVSSPTGIVNLTGLPFTCTSGTEYSGAGQILIDVWNLTGTLTGIPMGHIAAGSSQIKIYDKVHDSTSAQGDWADHLDTDCWILITGHYEV